MKVILFGATGMVGQGVLRECLADPAVERVLSVVRAPTGRSDDKLRELVLADFYDYSADSISTALTGYDACFFCLGVSAAGMDEASYRRVTYDLTLAAAEAVARRNPALTFIYVSGAGTDSTERGRSMWARVKGQTENALLRLPFRAVYLFRPGFIQPMHGVTSKTRWYRVIYAIFSPLYPVFNALFPAYVSSSDRVARAMIHVVQRGAPSGIFENRDINRAALPA